jgi:4'-phosphopantetheinyl transferase
MPPRPLTLARSEVHVWLAHPEQARDADLCAAYVDLCTEEERARHARHQIERHRHEFLVTRALVRTVLSRYAPIAPQAWRFVNNAHGRPEIAGPDAPPLRFNLSNTNGLVACAVALDRELGIDVESLERPSQNLGVADRFFSPTEVRDLRALPEADQAERFFTYWTLKESYIKARGMGLSIPLAQFSLSIEPERPVRIAFDPLLDDDADAWQLATMRPTERHMLAVAIRRKDEPDLDIVTRRVVPLREDQP